MVSFLAGAAGGWLRPAIGDQNAIDRTIATRITVRCLSPERGNRL
jgi:hypothetical protein